MITMDVQIYEENQEINIRLCNGKDEKGNPAKDFELETKTSLVLIPQAQFEEMCRIYKVETGALPDV